MRKLRWIPVLLLCVLALSAALSVSLAEDTQACDLTSLCKVTASRSKYKVTQMTDGSYRSMWESEKQKSPYVQIDTPKDEPAFGVYVQFGAKPQPWDVQVMKDGKWVTVAQGAGKYAHEYVALDGLTSFRVTPTSTAGVTLSIIEIHALSRGDVPSWVNLWRDAPDKVDLLVLSAHPDDEFLFFGGAIPTYAGERQMNVMVAYMTCNSMQRRSELLDALWSSGVKLYPDIGDFWDKYSKKLDTAYDAWGKTKTNARVVELLRRYKPDVVVTHDVKGEYGHGAHLVCADALIKCVPLAADASKHVASAEAYGVWAVKKVYLHLYKENAVEMDWDVPLAAFDGRTGFEVAKDAYKHYLSQQESGQKNAKTGKFEYFAVEPRGSDYSCYRFGLAYTTVGEDVLKNDFFENIPTRQ